MHNILVPTDFSLVADNALNYAIEIAAKLKSKLFLHHVYSMNKRVDYDWDSPDDEQPYILRIEEKMNFRKQKSLNKITLKGLPIQIKVENTHINSLFKRIASEYEIDLIIMGSKGASGLEKVLFWKCHRDGVRLGRSSSFNCSSNTFFSFA